MQFQHCPWKGWFERVLSFFFCDTSDIFLTTLFNIFEKYINIRLIFTNFPFPRDCRIRKFSSVFGRQFLVDFSQVCFLQAISCYQNGMWPGYPNLCSKAYPRFAQQTSVLRRIAVGQPLVPFSCLSRISLVSSYGCSANL